MRNVATPSRTRHLAAATITSFLFVLPLLILEIRNNQDRFPWALFGTLFLLPATFILILGNTLQAPKLSRIAISSVVLIAIVWLWVSLVVDQAPCFVGVANCD